MTGAFVHHLTGLNYPGASGNCEDPALVADAVTRINTHISWCLENAQALVYEELGLADHLPGPQEPSMTFPDPLAQRFEPN